MPFKKGHSGNPSGRRVGAKAKVSGTMRSLVSDFLSNNWAEFETSYKKLKPKDKAMLFEKMLKYGLPALQSVSITNEFEAQLKGLTDEQLEDVMKRILEHYNNVHNGKS